MWYLGDSLEWSLALPQIKSRYYTLSYWIFCHFFVDCKCKTKQLSKDFILQRQTGRKRDQAAKKSCNVYRVILDLLHDFHDTGKNSNAYRITLLSSHDFPACSLSYPVWCCSTLRLTMRRDWLNLYILVSISKNLLKGLIILAPARGVLADFCLPNEIDSWNFQQMLLF